MKKYIFAIAIVATAVGIFFIAWQKDNQEPFSQPASTQETTPTQSQELPFDKTKYSISAPDSLWVLVNKQRPINLEYQPVDLVDVNVVKRQDKSAEELQLRSEAANAIEELFAAAGNEGHELLLGSGNRSAQLQNTYYTNYVNTYGQAEADKFSAKPGTSEHQTGLGADVSRVDLKCYLEICFSETEEGKWVAANAHRFGFTIRYPEGKEDITGYQYEPWHLRYVGVELAQELHSTKQTMEEFFDLVSTAEE